MYITATAQYINYCLEFLQQQKTNAVNCLREWLGPAPQNFWLLDDGRVLPFSYLLPPHVARLAYVYIADTHQILGSCSDIGSPVGRFRRASPYLSVVIQQPQQEPRDLSDWINELKVNPTPATPFTLPQLVDLWAAVHGQYVNIRYTIQYINSEGVPGSLIIA